MAKYALWDIFNNRNPAKKSKKGPTPDDLKKAASSPQVAAYTAFKKVIPLVTAATAETLLSDRGKNSNEL